VSRNTGSSRPVKSGKIKKPIVAWATGTVCQDVQYRSSIWTCGVGSMANCELETADSKNRAMREAGMIVPETFEDLPEVLKETYETFG